ncbi:MAG: hypothetical protein ABSD96_05740 [Candidatus Korobacteraceae bacterium]
MRDSVPAGSSFPMQDVIAQPRRGPNGDAGSPSPDLHNSLSQGRQRDSRPWTIAPLPKEVIDYDNTLPLLAEPGMDRRRQTPDSVRQAMQDAWGSAASISVPPALAEPEAPGQEDLSSPAPGGEISPQPEPPLPAAIAGSDVEKPTPPAEAPSPSPDLPASDESNDSPTREKIAFNASDQPLPEPPPKASAVEASANELSRFLDFTPAPHEPGSVSGPSFLGLSGDAETLAPEEQPRRRKWPRYVASGMIAAVALSMVLHGTSLREAASRYARVGVTYANFLRTGTTATSNPEPSIPSADPASNQKSGPEFVIEEHPAHPAGEAASTAQPQATQSQAAESSAPESPAASAPAPMATASTSATTAPATNAEAPGPAKAVESKPLAAASPGPAAKPSKTVTPKPSARQSPPTVAGQAEYQQALAATNPEIARALLWRATALGNSDAQVRLADIYIYGQDVPQNCDQGLILLRSAAKKTNPHAQAKLGALYATGKCVSQDRVQAYRWLTLALNENQGSEWTEKNREMVWRQMSPAERSRATASR